MFGIGTPEILIIIVVALLVFGPSKLPELGKTLGKGLREFKKASADFKDQINPLNENPLNEGEHNSTTDAPATELIEDKKTNKKPAKRRTGKTSANKTATVKPKKTAAGKPKTKTAGQKSK